jgi:hypothetical protein
MKTCKELITHRLMKEYLKRLAYSKNELSKEDTKFKNIFLGCETKLDTSVFRSNLVPRLFLYTPIWWRSVYVDESAWVRGWRIFLVEGGIMSYSDSVFLYEPDFTVSPEKKFFMTILFDRIHNRKFAQTSSGEYIC